MRSKKILTCKDQIKDYIGGCSDYMFKRYVSRGLPALCENRRWIAHADNIDEFFRRYTNITMAEAVNDSADDEPVKGQMK